MQWDFNILHKTGREMVNVVRDSDCLSWIFYADVNYSKDCLFRNRPLNNLVKMSDTSRPIYHNELQMPRVDNNTLFIRRRARETRRFHFLTTANDTFFFFFLHEATKSFTEP